MISSPRRPAYFPVKPKEVTVTNTRPGWSSSTVSGSRSTSDCSTASALAIRRSTRGSPTRPTIERLPVFKCRCSAPVSGCCPAAGKGPSVRERSPSGGSTLITSAPKPARSRPAHGPAIPWASSMTRIPSSGCSLISSRGCRGCAQ